MFGSDNAHALTLQIDVDPGSTGTFHLMKAPRTLTVIEAYMISKNTQNDGTAVRLALQNWGTAGTVVQSGGTIAAALGGTAESARLTADVPAAATLGTAAYVGEGDWLVVDYTEQGTGWISGDRFTYHINYVIGRG